MVYLSIYCIVVYFILVYYCSDVWVVLIYVVFCFMENGYIFVFVVFDGCFVEFFSLDVIVVF